MAARSQSTESPMILTSLMAVSLESCSHTPQKRIIKVVRHCQTLKQIFADEHGTETEVKVEASCSTDLHSENFYSIDPDLTVGDLKGFYPNIKTLKLKCCPNPSQTTDTSVPQTKPEKIMNAFNVLMSGAKVHLNKKTTCHNRKDELYNDVVEMLVQKNLKIHKSDVADEGAYIVQIITNALWYLTNHHSTINDAALRFKDVVSIPADFETFQGYNNIKRKKLKSQPLDRNQLNSHSEAIYSLVSRPVFASDEHWMKFKPVIESLAECLSRYRDYLQKQQISQTDRQNADHPARTVGSDISVLHHPKTVFVSKKYSIFDKLVSETPESVPVLFDESKHLQQPFNDNKQRARYFDNMKLSVPVDLYKYCPGGSVVSIVFVSRVSESRSSSEALVEPVRVVSQIYNCLPEFHTRAQKRYFKEKLQNVACVKASIVDFIYKELAMDASQVSHPETQERLNLIALGETGLVSDLRELNAGRPSDRFDVFFEKLNEVVETVTAVDDRRHGELHLSRWINLEEMIAEAAERCPEGTLIPSKSLVRLQFTPRNPYSHASINFTGKIPVQYKIQRRQLRVAHQDQHFCAALYKYMKCKAIELGKYGSFVCSDDKAKVPVGNPGLPISTGVRGKKTITPTSSEMLAGDHDMHCSSLTPSVYLVCDVPDTTERSFVSGQVHVVVNDSVLQASSPFRHAAVLAKILGRTEYPKVLLRYSDGGTDQRNTLESVKCASICLFREFDLDMMVMARCAPGNSWANPAERVMSILNLGLQNCALERTDDDGSFKSVNSMSQVRELIGKKPELKDRWVSSIEPVQAVVQNCFARLSLKGKQMQIENPATDDDIDLIQRHLRELFPDLDLKKLQKAHTKSVVSYQTWLDVHTRQRQYSFQIRKCGNNSCCSEAVTPAELLEWLPDPVLETGKEHYKPYSEVSGQDTNDHDRPSYKAPESKGNSNIKGAAKLKQNIEVGRACLDTEVDASVFTAQNARYIAECVECKKPRVVYSKSKLTERQQMQLIILLTEHDYTCGCFVTVPGNSLHNKVHVRLGITCETPIELAFYRSSFAKTDMCCMCASANAFIDEKLRKSFKTVLPICQSCKDEGFEPVHARPYGKS